MRNPRKQLLVSLAFLISSVALFNLVSPKVTPSQPAPTVVVTAVAEQRAKASFVEGLWEQYAIENGERRFMARLDIRKQCRAYVAYPLDLSENTYPKHAYRSYDHRLAGDVWTFKEDWDYGQVGNFQLVRQEDGSYLGTATDNINEQTFETVFVRVSE